MFGYDDGGDTPAYSAPNTGHTPVTTYLDGAIDIAGTITYQHFNLHGDVIGTSNNTGVFSPITPADEFGLQDAASTTRLGWLGKQRRFEVGVNNLIRMGVRLYDPRTGRFTSVDPIEGGSANDYDYCSGDPINCFDLDGHWGWSNVKKWGRDRWKNTKSLAKRGLDNSLIRGIATGIVIGAVCSSGVGCALAVGAIAGGALGAANGYVNNKKAGVTSHAALGMIEGMKVGSTRLLLGRVFSTTGKNVGWLGASRTFSGKLTIGLGRSLIRRAFR